MWNVNLYLSHPDEENDDCETGAEFDTEAEARSWIKDLMNGKSPYSSGFRCDWTFVELDGPDKNEILPHPTRKTKKVKDNWKEEERLEIAREEGMLNGINSYNDWMGY